MKLFVGLGNPGKKYVNNRHNIGFMALDQIASDHSFSPWKSKFQGQLSDGKLGLEKVILLKPETFMNLSGQSVSETIKFYKIKTEDVVVFHDGHNGLRSIHQHIGADYHRVRMGIGHPGHKDRVANYVLSDFAKNDQNWLKNLVYGTSDGAVYLANDDPGKFMNAVAMKTVPQREKPKKINKVTIKKEDISETDNRSAIQKLIDKFSN